jgi:hypothetical protein
MLRSRRMGSAKMPPYSAATVRSRLLRDKTMRNNLDVAMCLSPAEQHRQAVKITHGFRHHYLAEITYLDDCQMTVAVIRSVNARHPAHEIWVDATGNVSVHHQDTRPIRHRLFSRVCIIPGILCVALGILFLAILI